MGLLSPRRRTLAAILGLSLLVPGLSADELQAQLERIFTTGEFAAKTFP